ncbi:MAG: PorP/SprF family type IX secretion system membrane protein [Flavobacteriales bacterium]|nr:PorP/SprF family type IX secretion system membrane protein [Flavobacteriales bacterium]
MKLTKKNTKTVIVALIGLALSGELAAQQVPLSNFYNFNEYLLNPAEAGYKDKLVGTASHRIQWQGLEGAPKTTFLGIHSALNEKMGLGVKVNVDQTDILKQFNAAISYAYRIKLNDKANLSFGLSGMMIQNSVGYNDAVVGDLADEVVTGGDQDGVSFDAEAGVMLNYNKLKVGISSSQLFESGVDYDLPDGTGTGTFERVRQFSAYGSYEFELSENWKLEPFVLMRNQGVESFQYELNALTTYKDVLYLGAGYRQEAGIIGRVGFQISDQIVAAYAYEFSGTGVASYSNGSHEFMLGYRLKKKAKKSEPAVKKELVPKEVVKKAVEKVEEKVKEEIQEVIPPVPPTPLVVEKPKVAPKPPKPEPVIEKQAEAVRKMFKEKIVFSFEGNKIPENIKSELDKIAKVLVDNPKERVRVEGHTSTDGTEAQNQIVSERRAKQVKDYLITKGVKVGQIETKAMLSRELLVPDTTLENKKINRRAEIELIK